MNKDNIKLFVHKDPVPLTFIRFPAGETLVRIESNNAVNLYANEKLRGMINLDFKDNGDLIDLMLLVDAIRREYIQGIELSLNMPYLPYARQDRLMSRGESLSVKVVADIINSLGFANVYCTDIHSEVGISLINNLRHIDLIACTRSLAMMFNVETTVLVSPDAGANKKLLNFAKAYGFNQLVRADKERDLSTGKITGTKVYAEHQGDKDFLVLDDIADGGYTFIELAKKLRELTTGKIYLYVTHGIFSKGIDILYPLFDKVYCSNIMLDNWKEKDLHSILVEV
jgi:ribose-phosphate pyrophosphokinase